LADLAGPFFFGRSPSSSLLSSPFGFRLALACCFGFYEIFSPSVFDFFLPPPLVHLDFPCFFRPKFSEATGPPPFSYSLRVSASFPRRIAFFRAKAFLFRAPCIRDYSQKRASKFSFFHTQHVQVVTPVGSLLLQSPDPGDPIFFIEFSFTFIPLRFDVPFASVT